MSPTAANSAFSTIDGRFVTRPPRRLPEPTRLLVGDDWAAWREPVMQRLEDLVQLPQGDSSARPVRLEVAHFTLQMLKSICPPDTAPPHIAAGSVGDLQVEWHTPSTKIELHVMAPNSVSAWRQTPSLANGEEAKLTNDFLIVLRWVREMLESGTPIGTMPPPIVTAATLSAETLSILDRLAYSVDQSVVDHEFLEKARAAKVQAVTLVRRNRLAGSPRVMMSDDGVLTLQWRNGVNDGAALIFPGDGTVSFAVKNAHQMYSDSGLDDVPLDAPLPEEFRAALKALVA